MGLRPIERKLQIHLPRDGRFLRVYLVFNVSRTQISLARTKTYRGFVKKDAGLLLMGESGRQGTHPNVLALDLLAPEVARDELLDLRIETVGEVPQLVRVVLEESGRVLVSKSEQKPCLDTIDLEYQAQAGGAAPHVPGPNDYLAELANALNGLTGPLADASRFFAEFDRRSSSVLEASAKMTNSVVVVSRMAKDRLVERLHDQIASPGKYKQFDTTNEVEDLRRVAALFVECAASHLGPPAPPKSSSKRKRSKRKSPSASARALSEAKIDLMRFEDAFEAFADGQLRLQLPSGMWSTQPSSGFYFYFAELALLAAEAKLDPPFGPSLWTTLAKVMIRTQETYCARYGPEKVLKPDRDTSSYSACQYRLEQDLDKPSIQRKAEMRQKFSKKRSLKPLAIACAENAVNLLRDEA
jgi:hypothetical protein